MARRWMGVPRSTKRTADLNCIRLTETEDEQGHIDMNPLFDSDVLRGCSTWAEGRLRALPLALLVLRWFR